MDVDEARARLETLRHRLAEMTHRDPEQEVDGMAIPVLDAVINASRPLMKPNDEVAAAVRDLISPEAIADGDVGPIRASDALLVVEQLLHSVPLPPAQPIDLVVTRQIDFMTEPM